MCDVQEVRVSGHVAKVAVAAAVLLGVAMPGQADPAPAGGAVAADRIERASRDVLDDNYQAELPRYREPTGRISAGSGTGSGDGDGAAGDGMGRGLRPRRLAGGELGHDAPDRRAMIDARDHEDPGAMSSLMTWLMWGMVIVMGVLIVFWIASEFSKYGGDAELPADEPAARMQAAVDAIIDRPLEDADELARRGLFAEAIHTLLLRTLQELVRSAAVRVAPAMTSREILARVPLLADARSALADLITAVEITHFGDEPANAADYDRCRRQFHVFAQAFRALAPAPLQAVAA